MSRVLTWASALTAISLVLKLGFSLGTAMIAGLDVLNVSLAGVYCWARVMPLLHKPKQWRTILRQHRFEYLLVGLFLGALGMSLAARDASLEEFQDFFHINDAAELYFDIVLLFLLGNVLMQTLRFQGRLIAKRARPELMLAGSFGLLIGAGTLLLLLPRAVANGAKPIGFVDALFTSTSAACVTGLVVRDTGTDYSLFGQMIIMSVFQVGGLGIMTFVAFLAVFSSESLPVPQVLAFKQMVSARTIAGLRRQIVAMIGATLVIELIGAALLYSWLPGAMDPLERAHWSLFHAISAFCNAGFALQADSLESLRGHTGMNLTFMALIVLGGLGFLVIPDMLRVQAGRFPWLQRIPWVRRWQKGRVVRRMSVQTKLSLVVTVCLLAAGFVLFWMLEAQHILVDKPAKEQLLVTAFQSVTARTAGFNTINIGQLQDATLILILVLMVIGACPVSTGGGIKTVTFGVLVLAMRAMFTGKDRVEAFGRTLPQRVLYASLSVFVLYVAAVLCGLFLMAVFDPEISLQAQAFEMVSALSTVGLSTGITAQLSTASKLVLCVAMFIGRIGPIALVLCVFKAGGRVSYEYPEEDVVVG